jgi:anti-sigma-K factor RskA
MNCSDFKEQVGAYALGALSAEESAEMEAHLAETRGHEGCEEELARAVRTTASLSSSLEPMRPRDQVWQSIESRLGAAPPAPRRAPRVRELAAWALAAGFIAAFFVAHDHGSQQAARADRTEQLLAETKGRLAEANAGLADRDRCLKELESMKEGTILKREAIALLEKPTTRVVALAPLAGKTFSASAIVNLAERRAIVVSSSMPHIADKDFELWVIHKEPAPVPLPAGFMHAAGGGIEVGEIDPRLLGADNDTFAVSLEPLGGATVPTEVLMTGSLPKG